jgi:hypothetical protein
MFAALLLCVPSGMTAADSLRDALRGMLQSSIKQRSQQPSTNQPSLRFRSEQRVNALTDICKVESTTLSDGVRAEIALFLPTALRGV